ncbi:hypothetical protein NQZ68_012032 [Dissostichus eleginoides]|nr:hypothetical protein NQZ68_012032 [Dissostichus eleginoides]
MEHNASVTAPHPAIHPAPPHPGSSRLCHTDGPLLCHEMSSVGIQMSPQETNWCGFAFLSVKLRWFCCLLVSITYMATKG